MAYWLVAEVKFVTNQTSYITGWIFLAILATVRIIGSGFEIAAVREPHNSTDVEWGAIL